jgi:hypothetical protein
MLKITFFITIALSPLYLFKISFFDINTNVFELLMLFSTLLCLLSGSFVFKKIFFKQHWLFFVGIFFLLLGLFISTFNTNYYLVSLGIIKSYFILPIIFSFALFGLLKNKADFENVLFCLFLSIFSISIISLVQKFLGLVSYDGRLAGIFNSPNYLAMFLAPGFFLWFFYFYSEKYAQNKYFKIFLSAALFSISLAFYFTYSYGAWFSVFLSFSLILYLKSDISLKKHFFLSLLLLLMFIAMMCGEISSTTLSRVTIPILYYLVQSWKERHHRDVIGEEI